LEEEGGRKRKHSAPPAISCFDRPCGAAGRVGGGIGGKRKTWKGGGREGKKKRKKRRAWTFFSFWCGKHTKGDKEGKRKRKERKEAGKEKKRRKAETTVWCVDFPSS